jgi:hypothetical protein
MRPILAAIRLPVRSSRADGGNVAHDQPGIVQLRLSTTLCRKATTVWFDGTIINRHVEPSPLWLSADGTLVVLRVHWSKWRGQVAVGKGSAEYHGCAPSCGQAPAHHVPVTINLWDVVSCDGHAYYNKVTLTSATGSSPCAFSTGRLAQPGDRRPEHSQISSDG